MMKKRIANWGNYPVVETDEKSFSFDSELKSMLAEKGGIIAAAIAIARCGPYTSRI